MAAALTSSVTSTPSGALHPKTKQTKIKTNKSTNGPFSLQRSSEHSLRLVGHVQAWRQDPFPLAQALHAVPDGGKQRVKTKPAESAVMLRVVLVPRDHHAIVGAELSRRTKQTQSGRLGDDGQNLPDVLVARHASGQHLEQSEASVRTRSQQAPSGNTFQNKRQQRNRSLADYIFAVTTFLCNNRQSVQGFL